MRTRFLIALVCALGLTGCTRSGDLGAFLVAEATRYGGRAHTNTTLPKLEGRWTVQRDRNGFEASVTDTSFGSMDSFMRQAFGAPQMSGFSVKAGQPHSIWVAADIGVAIQLIGRPDGAELVCVRGMSGVEEMFDEMDKPWWRKLWRR